MKNEWILKLEAGVLAGKKLEESDAVRMMALDGRDIYDLFPSANRIARHFKGYDVELCGIVNAKSGKCPEDCAFCAQSAHHRTDSPVHGLLDLPSVLDASREAVANQANRFGIVTSGTAIRAGDELDALCRSISAIQEAGDLSPCGSFGIMSGTSLKKLRDAGLRGYHHNLETARSFFPQICTTHDYEEDVRTVAEAKALGFMTCSGGIFGLGESGAQRVEMAYTLKALDVDSVPMNFLVPVKGTPMERRKPLPPLESLKIIAVYRFILPRTTLRICAGRDKNLGDLASWIFYAGADGMMVGNYLTTAGREPETDLEMIRALGFQPVSASGGSTP